MEEDWDLEISLGDQFQKQVNIQPTVNSNPEYRDEPQSYRPTRGGFNSDRPRTYNRSTQDRSRHQPNGWDNNSSSSLRPGRGRGRGSALERLHQGSRQQSDRFGNETEETGGSENVVITVPSQMVGRIIGK